MYVCMYVCIYIYIYICITGVLETVVFARPETCLPGMRKPWLCDP